jgi:hypothetical protein
MGLRALTRLRPTPPRRHPVDDAYTAWLSAHARCTEALRAWNRATSADRAIAYRVYRARLEREERAATALQRVQQLPAAA